MRCGAVRCGAVARASRGRRRRPRERVRGMSERAKRPSESVGEGVAERSARLSRGRVRHVPLGICERIGWGGCGLTGVRRSRSRLEHTTPVSHSFEPIRYVVDILPALKREAFSSILRTDYMTETTARHPGTTSPRPPQPIRSVVTSRRLRLLLVPPRSSLARAREHASGGSRGARQ